MTRGLIAESIHARSVHQVTAYFTSGRQMANVTFQVLDGLERGETFTELQTPFTMGREDENDIRLNDERVSRFHAKVQEDDGHIILTDLDSTNGTRVNGHPIQLHVLNIGDEILIGRCLLVYGSPAQLEQRIAQLAADRTSDDNEGTVTSPAPPSRTVDPTADLPGDLFPDGVPEPPTGLTPLQRAQVSDLVAFVHSNLTNVMHVTEGNSGPSSPEFMTMPLEAWHSVQKLQKELAEALQKISDP